MIDEAIMLSICVLLNNRWYSDLILIYKIRMRFYAVCRADKIYLEKRLEEFFMTIDIFNA